MSIADIRKSLSALDSREGAATINELMSLAVAFNSQFGIDDVPSLRLTAYGSVLLEQSSLLDPARYEEVLESPYASSYNDEFVCASLREKRMVHGVTFSLAITHRVALPPDDIVTLERLGKIKWVPQQPYRTLQC